MSQHDPSTDAIHTSTDARVLLALLSMRGMGRKTARRLTMSYGSLDELESVLRGHHVSYSSQQVADAYKYADEVLKRSVREGIHILSVFDSAFPTRLKDIDDPPLLLHVKGNLAALSSSLMVAIIGTREPTSFGEQSGRKIATTAAQRFFTVVSGLAKGCDTAAHWGCIDAKGKTIAVMAHGLDKVYPSENKALAREILANEGCLVSEYEVGQKAFKTNFVDRDRLQSGLSLAVILIETDVKGGSMHTARFAQQQHRILACVKHPTHLANEGKVQGNRQLLNEGKARPLATAEDVEQLLRTLNNMGDALSPGSVASKPPGQMSMF